MTRERKKRKLVRKDVKAHYKWNLLIFYKMGLLMKQLNGAAETL